MPPQQYLLGTRFYMPVGDRETELAIAVGFKQGNILQSLYTLMMQAIVIEVWTLVVLAGMAAAWRVRDLTYNMSITNIAIWNLQSSPITVAKTMFDHLPYVPGYALLWMGLAVLTVAGSVLLSTFVTPLLIAGQAAPANPDAVFVPSGGLPIRVDRVSAPASMRALSALDAIDPATGGVSQQAARRVQFKESIIQTAGSNGSIHRFDWTYKVSGAEFGLQRAPDLIHTAQGSCYTEYNWYQTDASEIAQSSEFYKIKLGKEAGRNISVDLSSKALLLSVFAPSDNSANVAENNISFALVASSADKKTLSKSDDPWYLTGDDVVNTTSSNEAVYQVQRGRPVLSCWQTDTWTVNNHSTSIMKLKDLSVVAPGLINVFQASLQIPRIITLSQLVGTMALKSSFGMQGRVIDAESASMRSDIERLVLGAYVATKNVLLDATLFDHGSDNEFKNHLFDGLTSTNAKEVGAGEFIIYGTDFMALRINVLVAVPVILVFLLLLVMFLTDSRWFSWPWRGVHAMDATILYNNMMNSEAFNHTEHVPGVVKSTPLREVDSTTLVRPTYDHRSSSYSWHRVPTHDAENSS